MAANLVSESRLALLLFQAAYMAANAWDRVAGKVGDFQAAYMAANTAPDSIR